MGVSLKTLFSMCAAILIVGCEGNIQNPQDRYSLLLKDVHEQTETMVNENWTLSRRLVEVTALRETAKKLSFEYGSKQRQKTCQPYELDSQLFAIERLLSVMTRPNGLAKTDGSLRALNEALLETAQFAQECAKVVSSGRLPD